MNFTLRIIYFLAILITCFACSENKKEKNAEHNNRIDSAKTDTTISLLVVKNDTCELERFLLEAGMVDIHNFDTSIKVDLKYSGTDNFLKIDLYGDFNKVYLHEDAARKLATAQVLLQQKHSEYSLIVYDAVRPLSITKMMWDSIKVPESQKKNFLAHPELGSMHNYGLAVDITIIDDSNIPLDMGTPFDSYEKLAYPMLEEQFLISGKLSKEQYQNRLLLREVMKEAGFNHIETEWWHFSIYSRNYARQNFAMVTNHKLAEKLSISEDIVAGNISQKSIEEEIAKNINITFRIQVLTSKQKIEINHEMFKGLKIQRYKHQGIYKYTTGLFADIQEAHDYQFKMWDKGFKDAFVAGFNNNERIGIYDAIELLELSK